MIETRTQIDESEEGGIVLRGKRQGGGLQKGTSTKEGEKEQKQTNQISLVEATSTTNNPA